jgi:hypothetical protein
MIQSQRATRRGLLAAGLGMVATGLPSWDTEASKKHTKRKKKKNNQGPGQHERQRQDEQRRRGEQRSQDEPQSMMTTGETLAPTATLAIGPGWTHVVGGGGSILFYNKSTGAGLAGTLDGRGFTPVEEYRDFAKGYEVIVGTSRGSVLLLKNPQLYSTGLGATGTLRNGRWTFLNTYRDFAPWTHGAAAGDSVFLYSSTGRGASGTLIDGAWSFYREYGNFYRDYRRIVASDDSLMFHLSRSSSSAKVGTLKDGVWTFTNNYPDFVNGQLVDVNGCSVGAGDTLLLTYWGWSNMDSFAGRLVDGAWRLDHTYRGFAEWSHAIQAGNGFVLLYDRWSGLAAWGTLGGGAWAYYGTT